MRSGVLIDPNFISKIKDDTKKINDILQILKSLVLKPEADYLIYRVDNKDEDIKESYKKLINEYSQDIQFKILIETLIEKFWCEKIDDELKIFKLGHSLTIAELNEFKNNNVFIKLLLNDIEPLNKLELKKTFNFEDLNKEKLKNIFTSLFSHVKSISFFDSWILEHTFKLDNNGGVQFYNKENSKFNITTSSEDHINTINFILGIIHNNKSNDKNVKVNFITSYNIKKNKNNIHTEDNNILGYIKYYIDKNEGKNPRLHEKLKEKFISLLKYQNKKDNFSIRIVERRQRNKEKNTVSEFYFKIIKIRYKSTKELMIECGKGINFFQGRDIKKFNSYRLKLILDDIEIKKYDSYRFHSEFTDEIYPDYTNTTKN